MLGRFWLFLTILIYPGKEVLYDFFSSEKTTEDDYVVISDGQGKGCSASVGKQGSRQDIWLSKDSNPEKDCFTAKKILHEFIHTFGFHHEHLRPDRDEYIKIKTENIKDYSAHNKILFDVMGDASTFNVDYDGNSVMHYTSGYMSKKSGMDTMVSKVGLLQF